MNWHDYESRHEEEDDEVPMVRSRGHGRLVYDRTRGDFVCLPSEGAVSIPVSVPEDSVLLELRRLRSENRKLQGKVDECRAVLARVKASGRLAEVMPIVDAWLKS